MIKINNTQTYKDKLVCEGILKMVDSKPIFISESEKIEVGDWVLGGPGDEAHNEIWQWDGDSYISDEDCKLLALPEHFSPQSLKDIVDGKLSGKCLVECERGQFNDVLLFYKIKLNPLTIYPVEEKMIPQNQVIDLLVKHYLDIGSTKGCNLGESVRKWTIKWFEQNVK